MVEFPEGKKLLFLAPMAGFSNEPCRRICREYGADVSVSEFVYSRAVLSGAARVFEKLSFTEGGRPFGVQIFGSDPKEVADAASLVEERVAPDFIDINFGCPAPNAVSAGAGAALLKNPELMGKIVAAVAGALKRIPVSAKMRIGWDGSSIIVPDAARALADAGASFITLHGRTKARGYEGDADWDLIEKTAQSLPVPLIGNGSVEKLDAARLRGSACAGFMVGRAALGNPWVFGEIRAKMDGTEFVPPTPSDRAKLALRYAELVSDGSYSGIDAGNLTFAKVQIMRFLKGAEGFKRLRVGLKSINTLEQLKEMLCDYV